MEKALLYVSLRDAYERLYDVQTGGSMAVFIGPYTSKPCPKHISNVSQ